MSNEENKGGFLRISVKYNADTNEKILIVDNVDKLDDHFEYKTEKIRDGFPFVSMHYPFNIKGMYTLGEIADIIT